jgi:hypothetical protein
VNLLIIGGLLAIAVVAILVAVLLGMSEQRAEKARINGGAALGSTATMPLVEQPTTSTRALERGTSTRQVPSLAEKPLRSVEEGQQIIALNGQLHELAAELRTLYQQAWELERRLRGLTEKVDHIEEMRNNQFSIEEEETHSQSSADSTTI